MTTVSSRPAPALAADPAGSGPIPLVRLDNADPVLMRELMAAVERVAARSAFTLGDEVEAFEREFADYCGTRHAIGVSSGTEAIVLSLRALGIGPGDEVVLPTNSFIATAEAVTVVGATPRLVDVDPYSGLLSPSMLENNLGPRTRCVIPVHLYGATVDMDPVVRVARDAGVAVIEDACQAHGARLPGGRVGSFGDCACFSFYPTKNLGGWGDGGAVVTSDPLIAERVELLRSHGERPAERHRHRLCGTTARLDGIQAAVLRPKLRRLEEWNEARRERAAWLTEALTGVSSVVLPSSPPHGDHVHHLYVVLERERDDLRAHLAAGGVATAVHYPVPIHLTEAYAHLGMSPGDLPHAERRAARMCSLPLYPSMTRDEVERVATAVSSFEDERRSS